jgi:hypothetical protein
LTRSSIRSVANGPETVDGDPVARKLDRQRLGEADQREAQRVGQDHVRLHDLHSDRGDEDDAAAAAAPHMRQDGMREIDHRQQRLVQRRLPGLARKIEKGTGGRSAGVADKDVELAEGRHDLIDGWLQRCGFGKIHADGPGIGSAGSPQVGDERLERGDIAPGDRDADAFSRKGECRGPAKAAGCCGYQRMLSLKTELHFAFPALSRIRLGLYQGTHEVK